MKHQGPRVGAYVLCVRDEEILLTRMVYAGLKWMLPGGGVEHGEDPVDAAVREVFEETGYTVEIDELIGVHNYIIEDTRRHALRIVYTGTITGGRLTNEVGGSSDLAAWFPLDAVAALPQSTLVDIALRMAADRPRTGRMA